MRECVSLLEIPRLAGLVRSLSHASKQRNYKVGQTFLSNRWHGLILLHHHLGSH